jgi:hypothetical protein
MSDQLSSDYFDLLAIIIRILRLELLSAWTQESGPEQLLGQAENKIKLSGDVI